MDILPDSRGSTISINRGIAGTWVPVYCANCGADGGMCPAEGMTFLFYLCNKCADTYGHIANTMMMPDEVFFGILAEEQQELYGRYLSLEEWYHISEDLTHPMIKLITQLRG